MASLGTSLRMSSARHPETDGQSERTIQTLEQILRHYINLKQTDWDLHLPAAEFAYNSAIHSSTGLSPFMANYGFQPHTPATLLQPSPIDSPNPAVNDALNTVRQTLQQASLLKFKPTSTLKPKLSHPKAIDDLHSSTSIVQQNIAKAQTQQAKYANQHRQDTPFKVGDLVLLRTKDLELPSFTTRSNRALSAKYIGPYPIIRAVGANSYHLQLPSHITLHPVVHASHLRPYHSSSNFPNRPQPPVRTDFIPESRDWEIKSIEGYRSHKGAPEFLIQWKYHDPSDTTWIPARHLENAHHLILEFNNCHALGTKAK